MAEAFPNGEHGPVPGIKVAGGFLSGLGDHPAEVRLLGSRDRIERLIVIFPEKVTDRIDDVVRFGTPVAQRPVSGGTFLDDGMLPNPSSSSTLQRRFMNGAPVEYDQEGDWIRSSTSSWGVATPP